MERMLNRLESDSYSSPECFVCGIFSLGIVCDSPTYGNANEAGSEMEDDDNYTYDY